MFKKLLLITIGLFSLSASAEGLDTGDTAWMLTSTALVLFMTLPGLALFYAGLVRSKNAVSVLMQCFTIACIASIVWVVYGYSLAFRGDGAFVGDLSAAFLSGIGRDTLSGTIPETVFVMFQMTFAIITPALVVGAFAERMKFSAMCLFTVLWLTFVYLPACHMVWGGGLLAQWGVIDFAGGLVVHLTCGVGALVAALVLGKRKGFPGSAMPPHNRSLVVMGAAMLWVGWFGFNAGSAVAASTDAGMAMLVTHISAAVAAFTWMALEWIKQGKPTVVGIATGMVAGLATITPAAGTVGPEGALLIGLLAGLVCYYATQAIKGVFNIDDSLDVFPVHGVGGMLGIIMLSFVGTQGGFLGSGASGVADGGPLVQLVIQLKGIGVIFLWTAVATWVILKLVGLVTDLRVSEESENEGLDVTEHEERSYDLS
ncbi:MAG TPA: ammonium transporter [Gammaproteobacteria bacterium]|jgi:Amt family ammonium transporter|nr:ammonium transporter [Gammaproteobacteria bacterium]HIA95843.1 ammonium transporter [Gammaproteobacteria bacterium]HIB74273.1 ammonium transporter [Gammaproteobacteria bacterium]HIO04426.1 ammonium transporter [Gammaproteobacteria bacterium]HIO42876.1 ammonium transporter [Gammaproteobacteria bacterium]